MTVRELIEMLEGMDPDATVRLATQQQWPFKNEIHTVRESQTDDDVVYIYEGSQVGYLSENDAEGWW